MKIDKIKSKLKRPAAGGVNPNDLLSSGSTLLNLACSGLRAGAFMKGGYYYFVGDSTSGKTFICLTLLAEAAKREDFDGYDFIYDGTTENGALMDIKQFFGSKVAKRLIVENSQTIDEMYYNLDERLNKDKPFIQIVDSMDGLDTEEDIETFKKQKSAFKRGKEGPGTYGMSKAKKNSQTLRKMLTRLKKSGSILIIVGQTRDKPDSMGYGDKRTYAGGRALKFYAQLELWSSVKQHITRTVNGKTRELGIISKVQVKKNRLTGRDRTVYIPIYHSFGIDDVGSCVDYLIAEGHWKGTQNKGTAPEFDFKNGKKSLLIRQIESNGEERELQALVRKVYHEIEDQCKVKRKARYE